ncbi:hypothetical protein IJ182_07610 [bacterium]|nr:hypothetical protein [bacterium]
MKKIILAILLFSFISTVPSFGMKIITNTDLDRKVPSRCMGPGTDTYVDTYVETTYNTPTNQKGYRYGWGYQGLTYEKYYKPVLGQGIRPELIGTTWDYPSERNYNPQKTVKKYTDVYNTQLAKRYMREAADYYVVDTISHPDNAVQAGYDNEI